MQPDALDDGVDLVFAALPHGQSQAIAPEIIAPRHPLRRSRRRFPARRRRRTMSAGTASRTRRPSCSAGSSTAFPRSTATRSPARATVAAAGCYPTSAILALKPLIGADRARTASSSMPPRASPAPARRSRKRPISTPSTRIFTAYGLLTHRHTAEMEMALGGTAAVHAASRADEPRHPRHLLRQSRRGRATRSRRCARPMRTSRSSTSPSGRPRPNGRWARTPSISPPATTSGPAGCWRSPRSTIS